MKNTSIIIYIAIAVGLFFTFIDPTYKDIKSLEIRRQDNENMIKKAHELRAKREDLMNKYNSISLEDRNKLNKLLPETVDNVRLILDIDNIARNYGIVLRGISISGEIGENNQNPQIVDRTGRKYGIITLSFSFNAPYETFKKFLRDLENSLRLVDVNSFTLSAGGQGSSDLYNYSLSLNTYWLR
jgi:Tfp pilus assembly protein PilO